MLYWSIVILFMAAHLGNSDPVGRVTNLGIIEATRKHNFNYNHFLDAAVTLIKMAKRVLPTADRGSCIDRNDATEMEYTIEDECPMPIDCEELFLDCGYTDSGIYRIYPQSRVDTWGDAGFDVYCDMETDGGGWTVFQRRDDYGASPDYFFKDWADYKSGFGDMNYDYWLGNDKIFALSNQRNAILRIDLFDFEGETRNATYESFYIDDESQGYRLHIGDFRGSAGDSFKGHNLMKFTTRDKKQDNNPLQNCALTYKGGWWYNNCHTANLNGLYLQGPHTSFANGVNWYSWRGFKYSLKRTELKLRSFGFKTRSNMIQPDAKRTKIGPETEPIEIEQIY